MEKQLEIKTGQKRKSGEIRLCIDERSGKVEDCR